MGGGGGFRREDFFCAQWKMEIHLESAGYKEIKPRQFKDFILLPLNG